MTKVKNIILGFGKGGKTLAKTLATKGEEVLVIESSAKMYGGTCINIGCLPSKRLIIEAEKQSAFPEAVAGKNEMTAFLRAKNYHMLADEPTVRVLNGTAKFIGDHEVQVTTPTGEILEFEGERIFINTGAESVILPIPGLKESKYLLDSTKAMDQTKLPQELVIIGAGYIGLEFAGMFARYGAKVTVLDASPNFIPREDDDVSQLVFEDMQALGIDFKLGVKLTEVKDLADKVEVVYEQDGETKVLQADKVLAATGRKPRTNELGLENTAIKVDERGAIIVDEQLHTTVPGVWALGDVKGGLQFTYISLDDFRIIKDELFGNGKRKTSDRQNVPYSVFLEPPLSKVGLNEKEAQAQGIEYKLFKLPVAAIPKARVLKDTRGVFKVLVDPKSDQLLGATLYGKESHELINLLSLALNAKLPYTLLRDQIYTHPTMSEALNDVLK